MTMARRFNWACWLHLCGFMYVRRHPDTLSRRVHFLMGAVFVIASGCRVAPNLGPRRVSLSDPNIIPMVKAIAAVDRTRFGFTPIPPNAEIFLETSPGPGYDTMLHVYANTQRTIAFRKTQDSYRWISEQEIHYGPKMFTDIDGTFQEHLVVEFQTEPVNGIPNNHTHISYSGQDSRLAGREDLTLKDIQPFIDAWKGTPIR